jgi:hypothetical protein
MPTGKTAAIIALPEELRSKKRAIALEDLTTAGTKQAS